MKQQSLIEWILRIAIAGEFLGHGVLALQGKKTWIAWMQSATGLGIDGASTLVFLIGVFDVLVALIVLVKPLRGVLAWAAFWGFFTAAVRPILGESFWDFIERFANWGAPLALLYIQGLPSTLAGWLKEKDA